MLHSQFQNMNEMQQVSFGFFLRQGLSVARVAETTSPNSPVLLH